MDAAHIETMLARKLPLRALREIWKMPQRPKNVKVVIEGDEPRGAVDAFAQARSVAEDAEARRAMIDAAAQDFMSKNAKLLKKLAE